MELLEQIKEVQNTNFELVEVQKLMEMEILKQCKYGNFLLSFANVAFNAREKERVNSLQYQNSEEKKALEKFFEIECFVANSIGISDDEFSSFNCKLLDEYLEQIKTYAA